jgi:hypothetical protein
MKSHNSKRPEGSTPDRDRGGYEKDTAVNGGGADALPEPTDKAT